MPLKNARKHSRRIAAFPEIPFAISVLIPTRNAGPEFDRCLRAIRDQRGVTGIELIVIDSSSTDGTPDLAQKHGALVKSIPVDQFNHGMTRNDLAELSNHSLMLFTVQDAFLVGSYALRDLALQLLNNPQCAAVSARQIPRTDADLFASYSSLAHETAMEWDSDRFTTPLGAGRLHSLPTLKRRQLTALDNVCCLVRSEVWKDLRFRPLPFSEDLDFGQRCVESGRGIGHSHSVAVIHSHNRPAQFHLRRHLVDRLHVARILNEPISTESVLGTPSQVAAAGRWFIKALEMQFRENAEANLISLMEKVRTNFEPARLDTQLQTVDADLTDDELIAVDRLLSGIAELQVETKVLRFLAQGWRDFLQQPQLQEFAQLNRWSRATESRSFISKLGAVIIGAALGNAVAQFKIEEDRLKELTLGI
jgi:GT2 family glycosyltransferase